MESEYVGEFLSLLFIKFHFTNLIVCFNKVSLNYTYFRADIFFILVLNLADFGSCELGVSYSGRDAR